MYEEILRARAENPFPRALERAKRYVRIPSSRTCTTSSLGEYQLQTRRFQKQNIAGEACRLKSAVTEKRYELFLFDRGLTIGGMVFNAYRINAHISDSLFADIMDSQSEHHWQIADCFSKLGKVYELSRPILDWDLLWIHPDYTIDWVKIVNNFIKSVKPDVLFLEPCAYYLPDATPQHIKDRAKSALRRLYTERLGAKLISDSDWMYRADYALFDGAGV